MTSSDWIAGAAFFVSLISFLYTIYYTHKIDIKNDKKEKRNFLKLLSSGLRGINSSDSLDEKLIKQGQIRDELNYCSSFCDDTEYETFKCDFDDKVYLIANSTNVGDFSRLHSECTSMLENFLKKV